MILPDNTTTRIIAQQEYNAKTVRQFVMAFVTASVVTFLTACLALTIFTLTAPSAQAATFVGWQGDNDYNRFSYFMNEYSVQAFATGYDWTTADQQYALTYWFGDSDPTRYGMAFYSTGSCTSNFKATFDGVDSDNLELSFDTGANQFKDPTFTWSEPVIADEGTAQSLSFSIVDGDCLTSEISLQRGEGYTQGPYVSYGPAGNYDLKGTFTFTDDAPGDPRADPVVTILEPDEFETVAQNTINALGADAFYFIVKSDVSTVEYPSSSPSWEVEVYDDAVPPVWLSCRMISAYSGTVDGTADYGTQTNHKVNGDPDPCSHFSLGDYSIRARVTFDGFDPSDWTAWWDFTVGSLDLDPPVGCPVDASFIDDFPCWATNAIGYLLVPSDASVQALFDTINDFGGVWPFSWFADSFGAFIGAIDVDAEDYGEADGGNPLEGDYPNSAWWVEKIQMWFGSWAAPAFAAFIWIGACLAILRAGMRLLNIEYEEVDDV